ncbi:glutathione S-transferase, partial [Salipiger aestuarii]
LHDDMLTETDLRLWPTLARFDAVYHGHFKCARRRLIDYPNLWGYARDIMTWKGVAETFDEAVIRAAYYGEDRDLNPFGIVEMAPALDWTAPHDRGRLGPATVAARAGRQIEVNPTTLHAVEVSARTRCPNSKALLRTDTR